jgi:hypothetical protein
LIDAKAGEEAGMQTENESRSVDQEQVPAHGKIVVELEQGSVSVSREGLSFAISGKNVKLRSGSPLSLTFDSGEVQFDDNEIAVRAKGEDVKLQLD